MSNANECVHLPGLQRSEELVSEETPHEENGHCIFWFLYHLVAQLDYLSDRYIVIIFDCLDSKVKFTSLNHIFVS